MPFASVVYPDPHNFGNLNSHPDPHSHEIKIRIRIKIFKLDPERDPDPHQFADVKPKCTEYEPILALFQGFEPLFKATDPDPHQGENPDPHQIKNQNLDPYQDPYQGEKSNSDPHQGDADPQHCHSLLPRTAGSRSSNFRCSTCL
jgi:hypothetical protein